MLLVVCGLGFDGLDGWLHRRSGRPGTAFGRAADSIADSVTFGAAPAVLLADHPYHAALWAPYHLAALGVGALVLALAITRLAYFTLRAYDRPHFVGVPTPQNALGTIVLLLFFADPAFAGTSPTVLLIGAAVLAGLMVAPIRYPKIRRGAWLRRPMTLTGVALVGALLPLQFVPARGTPLFAVSEGFAVLAAAGIGLYYLLGPWSVGREAPAPARRTA